MILSAPSTCEAGVTLAERLGLSLAKREGNNLAGPCPYPGCGSSDAFRLEVDTGVGHCFACGQKSSPYALAEMRLRTSFAATQLLKDLGLWRESETSQCIDPIATVAAEKRCPRDALVMFGAAADDGCVRIPTWGPDGKPLGSYSKATGNGTVCGSFRMWPGAKGDIAKGLCEKGKRAGMFFPGHKPQPGEAWVLVEGVKDAAALLGMGYAVAGLHGNTMHEEYGRLFRGVNVTLCPDADSASHDGTRKNTAILQAAGAASVKVAILPATVKPSHGEDVRDVIRRSGPDAVRKAIDEARSANEVALSTRSATQQPSASTPTPIAPGTKVRALDRENFGEVVSDNGDSCIVHFTSPEGQHADVSLPKSQLRGIDGMPLVPSAEPPRFIESILTSEQLDELDAEPRYIVKNAVVAGQMGALGAKQKGCKTSIVVDLVVSAASGTMFLDEFQVPEPVPCLFLCGESGASRIRRQTRHICDTRGLDIRKLPIWWGFDLPKLCLPEHVAALADFITENKIRLIPIDPLYLSLFTAETAGRSGDLFTMGVVYEPLTKLCRETGAAILLVHHFRKNRGDDQQEPCSLEELTQAGLGECARWWILAERREPYAGDGKHALWLRIGGSEGHASFWALDIDEGLTSDSEDNQRTTKWETTLARVRDAKAEEKRQRENRKATDQERKESEHAESLVRALMKYPAGQTMRQLRADSRLNADNFLRAVAVLRQAGRIEEIAIQKQRGNYDGFKLKS